jgi:hypothetical protein
MDQVEALMYRRQKRDPGGSFLCLNDYENYSFDVTNECTLGVEGW